MNTFLFFSIASTGLIAIIGFRVLELALGRDIIPAQVRDTCDRGLVRALAVVWRIARNVRIVLRKEMHKIPMILLHTLVAIWAAALKKTLTIITNMQKRSDSKTRRIMQAYLETVSAFERKLRS